jgi:hypothetical protein
MFGKRQAARFAMHKKRKAAKFVMQKKKRHQGL